MTIPFHNLATKSKIVLFCLPPHSTHLIQHLDVGIFQSFKHYHTDAIDKAVRGWVMKNLVNLSFWPRFSHFATKPSSQPLFAKSTDLSAFCSRRRLWQNSRKANSKSGDCPSNSFFSPPSIAATYPLGTCLCCQVRAKVTESLYQTETRRESWLWANTTVYSWINRFRSYIGVEPSGKTGQFRRAICPEGWDDNSQWVSRSFFQKERKTRRNEREEKRAEKLAHSPLAQIEFLIGGLPPVE